MSVDGSVREPGRTALCRLLRLAMAPAVHPSDLLVEHSLSQPDHGWIDVALDAIAQPLPSGAPRPQDWPEVAPAREDLAAARSAAKRRYQQANDVASRSAALFGYAWCVAANIVHFGATESTESIDSIHGLLGAAAAAAPVPMRGFLSLAIAAEI